MIEIERLERALARRPALAERLFRPAELAAAASHRRAGPRLAARFAAKEAAIKALGGGCGPRDIEVTGGGAGAPGLLLHGRARARADAGDLELAVSLTHARESAAAVVIARPRRA